MTSNICLHCFPRVLLLILLEILSCFGERKSLDHTVFVVFDREPQGPIAFGSSAMTSVKGGQKDDVDNAEDGKDTQRYKNT